MYCQGALKMCLPEFEKAQYIGCTVGLKERCKYVVGIVLKCVIKTALFLTVFYLTFIFFKFIVPKNNEAGSFNSLSVGAALITFFSAMISLFSLADSECMKRYENNLQILESRYLNNQKIFGWNFLQRRSYNRGNFNYQVNSAFFTLYADNNLSEKFKIAIPALSIDMLDAHCIREIYRLKKFTPKFVKYLLSEDKILINYGNNDRSSKNAPLYYITLPNNISALYQNVLSHKIINHAIIFFLIFLICAIIITIIYPSIILITM